jgi:gliding motility-associated-like protein
VYVVTAIDANGCVSIDTVVVTVTLDCGAIYIPNVFSPNGDGNNDVLFVRGGCIRTLEFAICDRWGERVFSTEIPTEGWDGTYRGRPMNSAVFYYNLKVALIDGTEIKRKGSISLVR